MQFTINYTDKGVQTFKYNKDLPVAVNTLNNINILDGHGKTWDISERCSAGTT